MGWSRLGDDKELTPAPTPQEVAPSAPHHGADAFPVGNKVPETQLPSFLSALEREGTWGEGTHGLGSGREASLGRGIWLLVPGELESLRSRE